jgi:D-glycero-D-manno-heptose 1,7-bisphosphate phosphatase
MSHARAAFLDRDGVISELVADPDTHLPEAPLSVDDVALIPGAAEALRELHAAGWLLVGVSNQPAAAKGKASWGELEAIQRRVLDLLAGAGVHFDGFYLCPHHPDGVVAGISRDCDCRKPRPGMLVTAAHELGLDLTQSWMIGDTDTDVGAGRAAGCRTALVRYGGSAHKRSAAAGACAVVDTLGEAVEVIIRGEIDVQVAAGGRLRGPE